MNPPAIGVMPMVMNTTMLELLKANWAIFMALGKAV